ncbi:hypothetical protein HanLR1_Chr00c0288g0735741 [Helianthus annuus]|nr:hypothetical protein HanHA89_Chr11g0410141 [Helianthus annuus]KAJ0818923.1 hypothetical protein HanLR1_Chr00c0288g0735741 [Helianthus annuus]
MNKGGKIQGEVIFFHILFVNFMHLYMTNEYMMSDVNMFHEMPLDIFSSFGSLPMLIE